MYVSFASIGVEIGVNKLFVEGNVWRRGVRGDPWIGKCCNFIGADGGIDGGLNGEGSGEWKHEGWWVGEVAGKGCGSVGDGVFIGPKNPLLLLSVNDVGEASIGGNANWQVCEVVFGGCLGELMGV